VQCGVVNNVISETLPLLIFLRIDARYQLHILNFSHLSDSALTQTLLP